MLKKNKFDNTATNTVIGDGIIIEGTKITGSGSIRIDGRLIGGLDIDGNLTIGESGHVQGDIKVNNVLIAGKMDGNIVCREGIHLASTAQLNGNMETASLVVDEGALFTGTSYMNTNSSGIGERNQWQKNMADTYRDISEEAV